MLRKRTTNPSSLTERPQTGRLNAGGLRSILMGGVGLGFQEKVVICEGMLIFRYEVVIR